MEDASVLAQECINLKVTIKNQSSELKTLRKDLKTKEQDLMTKMIQQDLTHIATDSGVYTLARKITFT